MPIRRVGQGASSVDIRHYNQRLILQRLRRLGEASRADLARAASLTNTAVGEIIKQLEQGGLVRTIGKRHEGMRGQPATMLGLDPRGAYAIGVRLDRTRIETALTDLGGNVLSHRTHDHTLPAPAETLELVRDDVEQLVRLVPAARRRRITGIGVARPYNLGSWLAELDLAAEVFAPWEDAAFAADLERACGLQVVEENDGTAASIAELFHGHGRSQDDFLYIFIGPAIGGGLALAGQSVRGYAGNAGDVGMIPVQPSSLPSAVNREGRDILLGRASLNAFKRHLRFRGITHAAYAELETEAGGVAAAEWLADCAEALTEPLLTARALLDVPVVVIDSDLPSAWIDRLLTLLTPLLTRRVAEARTPPALLRGSFGAMAGALGAATLPLFLHFGPGAGSLAGRQSEPNRQGGPMPSSPEPNASDPKPILEMHGISKTFPGVKALNNVQLTVYPGEVHALMGENGAGKSTLMKILSGAYTADPGGEIRVNGKSVHITGPLSAKANGIAIIYQELSLSPNLTVAENIYLGREVHRGPGIDRAAMYAGCADVLARLGATFGPRTMLGDLSIAEQQMVEVARAIHAHSRILVMDEPTTALSNRETRRLFDLILRLKAEGLAIIYISHRMAEVYELAERVSVLRDGGYVGTLDRTDLRPETIVRMMVGRDLSSFYKKEHGGSEHGAAVLEVAGISDGKRVKSGSLNVHAGEVVGLAGLVGAGRTELARLVYGAELPVAGTVRLEGRQVSFRTPSEAIDAGLVYLTEDRKAQGLFLDMTVGDNINLGVIARDAAFGGWLDLGRARQRALAAIKALTIRVPGPEVPVGALSGGNQQKVLLSRLLETRPKVLILDEPTRGVDVGAKSEIYRIIDDLAKQGAAVLVISSELPEIVGIADRVVVMREGETVGEVGGTTGVEITEQNIMALATGVDISKVAA